MKQLFQAIVLWTLTASPAFAQHRANTCWPAATSSSGHVNNYRPAARTTAAAGRRLITASSYSYDTTGGVYVLEDTASLDYPGGRGSAFSFFDGWVVEYDTLTNYVYGTWQPFSRTLQAFDASDNSISSTKIQWIPWLAAWRNSQKVEHMYDASGNMTSETLAVWDTTSSSWQNYISWLFSYNSANQQTHKLYLSWNGGTLTWDSSYQAITTYNAANQKIMKLESAKSVSSGLWQNQVKTIYTYDGAGNNIKDSMLYLNTTTLSWDNSQQHVRSFDAAGHMLTDTSFTFNLAGEMHADQLTTYSAYAGSNPGTIELAQWDTASMTFQNFYQTNLTYGSDGQPDYYFSRSWDITTSSWLIGPYDRANHYYYESYTLRADLHHSEEPAVLLSPIPVGNQLAVALEWAKPQSFTIQVCDVLGQIHYAETIGECSLFKGNIPVDALPTGNYVVKFTGALQQCTRLITVAR